MSSDRTRGSSPVWSAQDPEADVTAAPTAPREPGRRPRGAHLIGLLDQILSSASNLVLVVVMARLLGADAFGRFALAYATTTFALALTRAALGTRLTLTDTPEQARSATGALLASTLLLGPAIATAVFLVGLTAGHPGGVLLVLSLATPVVCAQDIVRVGALSSGRPGVALASDAAWAAALVILLLASTRISPVTALLTWALAGLLALGLACVGLRETPSWHAGWSEIRRRDAVGHAIAAGAVVTQAATLIVLAVVAQALGPILTGSLRGASTAMGPVNVLLAFTALQLTSSLARAPREGDRRSCVLVAAGLAAATAAWAGILLVLPHEAGTTLFGSSWDGIREVLPWTTVEYLLLAVASAAALGLRVRRRARDLLTQRLVASATTVVVGCALAALVTTARPFAAVFAAAAGLSAAVAWRQLLAHSRTDRPGPLDLMLATLHAGTHAGTHAAADAGADADAHGGIDLERRSAERRTADRRLGDAALRIVPLTVVELQEQLRARQHQGPRHRVDRSSAGAP